MKFSRSTWIAIICLVIWLLLSWKLGVWIGLKPPKLYYLRGGLALIGILGFVGYLLLRPKTKADQTEGWAAAAIAEVEFNFQEATKRVQAGGVKHLNQLPAVFLVGDAASAKTSIIAKSGLEPELLAGHAYQDYVVAPTRVLNLWFARQILFIDPAGAVVADAGVRKRLFKKFAPVRLRSVLGGKQPPPRSVVFTLDCDTFLQAGGADALAAKAREFQTILTELSQELGSNFPVYVLFTKTDKLPYFRDYVETFTENEATEVFGATLPMQTAQARGVYAEHETRRLTEAFQELYLTLCAKRPVYLAREHDQAKLSNIYEFPREFAKLRPLLVQFLVDLCRPSQLGTSPFLRGFYFTGVRPVSVADLAPAASFSPAAEEPGLFDAGATRIFNPRSPGSGLMQQAEVRESGARRVPQWVFLSHLISELILVDQPALISTQGSVKLNFWRRALLASATALALFMAIWWIVSYRNNNALVKDAAEAARAVPSLGMASGQLASLDSLQRLDRVRRTLAQLEDFDRNGVPFGFSGGLYKGDSILDPLRKTYYSLFRKILLFPTQQTLIALCTTPEPYRPLGYLYVYNALKAYLITTNYHEKSTAEFLAPELLLHWQKNQQVDSERTNLANQNFEFYAGDLTDENPYPKFANPDSAAVENARAFLNGFGQAHSIYANLLTAAGKGIKPIVFNTDYPESRGLIINTYRVEPAFTKLGYTAFMKLLQDPSRYPGGEEWVLGPQVGKGPDKQKMEEITLLYRTDFVKTWRSYLHATSFAGYASVPDAVVKLGKLISNTSPILEVLCVASENTSVEMKEVADIFQPVQFVTPAGCLKKLSSGSNQSYISGLISLQPALKQYGDSMTPELATKANDIVSQDQLATTQLATGFNSDRDEPRVDSKTANILMEPLVRVPPLLEGAGKGPINAAAKGMCQQEQGVLSKYPFNRASKTDASVEEVTEFLKPKDGRLWKLKEQLDKLIEQSSPGGDFTPKADASLKVSAPFLRFFNRAVHMSDAMFKGGSAMPSFTFSIKADRTEDVEQVGLTLYGTQLVQNMHAELKPQTFTWPGTKAEASVQESDETIDEQKGPWAVWHLLDRAENWRAVGNQYQIEWIKKNPAGGAITRRGHPVSVKFTLDPQGSQVFKPGYFSGLGCVATAVP